MSGRARPAGAGAPRLSVVVPAYNEADRLGATLAAIRGALNDMGFAGEHELIVVDDGSSDGTAAVAAGEPGVHLIRQAQNRGELCSVEAGAEDPERHLRSRAGYRAHSLTGKGVSQVAPQLDHLLRERVRS